MILSDALHSGLRVRLNDLSLKLRPQVCTVWNEAVLGMSFLRFVHGDTSVVPTPVALRVFWSVLVSILIRSTEIAETSVGRLPDKLLPQLVPRGPCGPVFLFPLASPVRVTQALQVAVPKFIQKLKLFGVVLVNSLPSR